MIDKARVIDAIELYDQKPNKHPMTMLVELVKLGKMYLDGKLVEGMGVEDIAKIIEEHKEADGENGEYINATKCAKALSGKIPIQGDKCAVCSRGENPDLTAAYMAGVERGKDMVRADNVRMREALESIVKHQTNVAGALYPMSSAYKIAKQALVGKED